MILVAIGIFFIGNDELNEYNQNSNYSDEYMKINTDPIFSYTPIPKEVKEKMLGFSMPENIPISFDELSYLTLSYYGFDGNTHVGEMIVNKRVAADVVDIFKEIYEKIINDKKIIDRYENIRKFEDKTGGWAYHDLNHIKRVEKIIDNVLNKLDFDEEFIYKEKIACVLHDTGAILGKENHAYRSYLFAKDYFINNDIKFDDINLILDAIKNHSDGFETDNLYGIILIFADKLDMTKERLSSSGKKVKGNKEYSHVNDIDITIENNNLKINFITDGEVNLKEINEYYFTKKIFKGVESFSNKLDLKYIMLMDNKKWKI